jgi:hypothetical protein
MSIIPILFILFIQRQVDTICGLRIVVNPIKTNRIIAILTRNLALSTAQVIPGRLVTVEKK